MDAPLHPDLAGLAVLLGTWRGQGRGEYPTIEPFAYREEVVVSHVGKPFLSYRQATRHADTGQPLHAEAGYLRPGADAGSAELVIAQPSGIVEVHHGSMTQSIDPPDAPAPPFTLEFRSAAVVGTDTAKEVGAVTRRFVVAGDTLTYTVAMEAVGQPLQHHLAAELQRAS